MSFALRIAAIGFAAALGGCGTSGTWLFTGGQKRLADSESQRVQEIDYTGIHPVLERNRIEPINLEQMLDPQGKARVIHAESQGQRETVFDNLVSDRRYEYAFEAFSRNPEDDNAKAQRRNRILDRILLSSEQRCGIYRRLLLEVQSDANFWLGTGATISGLLGPLFGERGAKNLAALAGAFSGTQAQVSQSYFYNLAVPVITKGIEERRRAVFERIRLARTADIHTYTVQAAVRDAVFYDAQCSIIAGLEEAAEAIRVMSDPGLEAANRTMLKAKVTRAIVSANTDSEVEALGKKIRELESSPLMSNNRFSQIGVPLAGVGSSSLATPATIALAVKAALIEGDAALAADDHSYSIQRHAAAVADKKLPVDSAKPTAETLNSARKPLTDAIATYNDTVNACVGKLAQLNSAYAAEQGKVLTASSELATALPQEELASMRRQSVQIQRVLESARQDLMSTRQSWREAIDRNYKDKKADLPTAGAAKPDPAPIKVELDKFAKGTCKTA